MRRQTYPPECGELRSIGQIAAEVVADLRFRRKVIRLHRQGSRAVGEFLAGLGAELGVQTGVVKKPVPTISYVAIEAQLYSLPIGITDVVEEPFICRATSTYKNNIVFITRVEITKMPTGIAEFAAKSELDSAGNDLFEGWISEKGVW